MTDRAAHWNEVYASKPPNQASWFQAEAQPSMRMIRASGIARDAALVDIGGGASVLVDELLTADNHHAAGSGRRQSAVDRGRRPLLDTATALRSVARSRGVSFSDRRKRSYSLSCRAAQGLETGRHVDRRHIRRRRPGTLQRLAGAALVRRDASSRVRKRISINRNKQRRAPHAVGRCSALHLDTIPKTLVNSRDDAWRGGRLRSGSGTSPTRWWDGPPARRAASKRSRNRPRR